MSGLGSRKRNQDMTESSIGIQLITPDTGTAQQRPPPPPAQASASDNAQRAPTPPELGQHVDKVV